MGSECIRSGSLFESPALIWRWPDKVFSHVVMTGADAVESEILAYAKRDQISVRVRVKIRSKNAPARMVVTSVFTVHISNVFIPCSKACTMCTTTQVLVLS